MTRSKTSEGLIRDIKRKTRRKYSSEEKIRIVIEGMRGETSIAELCRKEEIAQNLYYRWSKDFMESGRRTIVGIEIVHMIKKNQLFSPKSSTYKSFISLAS